MPHFSTNRQRPNTIAGQPTQQESIMMRLAKKTSARRTHPAPVQDTQPRQRRKPKPAAGSRELTKSPIQNPFQKALERRRLKPPNVDTDPDVLRQRAASLRENPLGR